MPDLATSNVSTSSHSAFISHASDDSGLAQQLCARLEAQGIKCWIAPRDLTPGQPYPDEIVRGIETTDALILIATPAAVISENVLNELEQAHRMHKTLLTVMVGKPQISRQLSYYISRLHWIEASCSSVNGVADRLAHALQGAGSWEMVASRPSLSRWFIYGLWRRFLFPAVSAAVVIVLVGAIAFYFVRARLATDYRNLGWVTIDGAEDAAAGPISIGARVWIGNHQASLSDVSLQGAFSVRNESVQRFELMGKQNPLQIADGQQVAFTIPAETSQLTTCLIVPGPEAGAPYRITQDFSIVAAGGINVAPAGPAKVSKEDGAPCGP